MRRAALGAVLAALVLSGCDVVGHTTLKPQPKPMSHAQLVRAGNRACVRFVRRIRNSNFTRERNFQKLVAEDRRILIPAYERLLFELHGLAPPPADAVAYRRMLATFNYLDLNIHQLLDAGEAAVANHDLHQLRRVRTLQRRVVRLGKRFNARAKKLGLRRCA